MTARAIHHGRDSVRGGMAGHLNVAGHLKWSVICCLGCACLGLALPVQGRETGRREARTHRTGSHAMRRHTRTRSHHAPARHARPSRGARHRPLTAAGAPPAHAPIHSTRGARIMRPRRPSPASATAPPPVSNAVDARRVLVCGSDGIPTSAPIPAPGILGGTLGWTLGGPVSPLAISFNQMSLGHGAPAARPTAADAQPAAPDTRAAVPSDVNFIGLVEAEHQELKLAVLRVGHRIVYGRKGDLLAGRYRLVMVSEDAAQIFDIDTAATRTLAMDIP
jgi:hypothetical protein